MHHRDVVVVSAVRTPFGRFDGAIRGISSIDLGVEVLEEVLSRIKLAPEAVDELYYGTCIPAEYAAFLNIPGRQASLLAGFPAENLSMTIDRACCSSMTALRQGFRAIRSGDAEIAIGCGAENMGNAALLVEAAQARWGNRLGHIQMTDILFELGYGRNGFDPVAVETGEAALEYGISREDQDLWALGSQQKWASAHEEGRLKVGEELMSLSVPQKKGDTILFETDESPRDTSLEKLARLKTVYGSPTVTPGNAPGMNAGASAIIIMSRQEADRRGLEPLATIEAMDWAGGEPKYMSTLPAKAIQKMLGRLALAVDDIDLIEINEAFAAVTLVSLKIMAGMDAAKYRNLQEKTNVNGGAIAIGHPVGASGARITMALMYELRRRGGGLGAAAICGGLGQGESLVLRV